MCRCDIYIANTYYPFLSKISTRDWRINLPTKVSRTTNHPWLCGGRLFPALVVRGDLLSLSTATPKKLNQWGWKHHKDEFRSLAAAAAAKSLQLCPTLCDPIDGSPPGSSVHGILQAIILEWVAISFSIWNPYKLEKCDILFISGNLKVRFW